MSYNLILPLLASSLSQNSNLYVLLGLALHRLEAQRHYHQFVNPKTQSAQPIMLGVKYGQAASCRHDGRGNYIHFEQRFWRVFSTAAAPGVTGCIYGPRSGRTIEKCILAAPLNRAEWSGGRRKESATEARVVDSFPLCKEAVAHCPTLRHALTAFWCWTPTGGLCAFVCSEVRAADTQR